MVKIDHKRKRGNNGLVNDDFGDVGSDASSSSGGGSNVKGCRVERIRK